MIFGPRRAHPLSIFEHGFRDFGLLFAILLFCFFSGKWDVLSNFAGLLSPVLILPISKTFSFFFTNYSIDNEKLYVKKGFLNKKTLEIPLNKITNIDISQGIIFQIAGVQKINIDTGAQASSSNSNKLTFSLKEKDALLCKKLLLNSKQETKATPWLKQKKASAKELLAMALMEGKIIILIQIVSFAFIFIPSLFSGADSLIIEYLLNLNSLFLIAIIFLSVFLFVSIAGIITTFIKFYNFIIEDYGDSLILKHGLFTRQSHTIVKKKISGINFHQSFFMKILGYGELKVFALGYDSEAGKNPIHLLFPLLKKQDLEKFLNNYIPNLYIEKKPISPPKIRYFFISEKLFFNMLLCIAAFVFYFIYNIYSFIPIMGCFFFIGAIASCIMEYKNTCIFHKNSSIFISSGGFAKNNIFLNKQMVESVTSYGSFLKRRKGIASLSFGVWSDTQHSMHKVKNLPLDEFSKVASRFPFDN